MSKNRVSSLILLCLMFALGGLVWKALSSSGSVNSPDEILAVENRPRIVRPKRPRIRAPSAVASQPSAAAEGVESEEEIQTAAMALAWPGKMTVSCPASNLQPGLLRPRPTLDSPGGTALFAVVEEPALRMVVEGRQGAAILHEGLSPVARVSWSIEPEESSGSCRVGPLRTQTIRGRVVDTDQTPVDGVEVRGCVHGDIVMTDEEGGFSIEAVEGSTCFPMAFLDRDGVFARSDTPRVDVGSEPPEEVRLTLWEGWSAEEQIEVMGQMAVMLERMANKITEFNPAAQAAERAEDPGVAEQLYAWGLAEQAHHDRIWDDVERLTLDENPYVALRDLWLNQY